MQFLGISYALISYSWIVKSQTLQPLVFYRCQVRASKKIPTDFRVSWMVHPEHRPSVINHQFINRGHDTIIDYPYLPVQRVFMEISWHITLHHIISYWNTMGITWYESYNMRYSIIPGTCWIETKKFIQFPVGWLTFMLNSWRIPSRAPLLLTQSSQKASPLGPSFNG